MYRKERQKKDNSNVFTEITYREAIRQALTEEMERDETVFLMGEDIGLHGGVFKVSEGLLQKFGKRRVRNTPISEATFTGAGTGAAMAGLRPVIELMYLDFILLAMDQVVNQMAKIHYMSEGRVKVPLTIRTQAGAGTATGAQHSQCLEACFMHLPGVKVAMPSTPYDVKGILKTAIRSDDPVIVIEHRMLYNIRGKVPDEEYIVPLGKADIKKRGKDFTIVAHSRMVHLALEVADELWKEEKISLEVVDPISIVPLDFETIIESVKKTGRLITIEEGCLRNGVGAEISAQVTESAFDYLDAPIRRIAGFDIPIPASSTLEEAYIPSKQKIIKTIKETLCL